MELPARIVNSANMDWLKLLTPLRREETRQRENNSDYKKEDARPVDVPAADALARDSWELAYQG